jgi:hypothetical protein
MNIRKMVLPVAVLGTAAAMLVPVEQTEGYALLGFTLPTTQRDFRVWNNFTDTQANNNQTPDGNFPGYQGAVMAIWKGTVEWGSQLHGNGNGDPHQFGGLGSGGANFDASFQGLAVSSGGINDNIHSEISGCSGGVLAFTESPDSFGWRIRYYQCWTWEDGPGTFIPNLDLQGVACHEVGHAIGMGHTNVLGATMYPSVSGSGVSERSIAADDINGVRAAYGVAAASKPRITGVCVSNGQIVITGSNFSPTNNEVWFTQAGTGGTGFPIKSTGNTSDGTTITANIPVAAGPGDVLVRNNGSSGANLSNAWPTNLQDSGGNCGGGTCPTPQNYCFTSPNSVGPGMVMSFSGSSCASDEDVTLEAIGGPPNKNGIFYYGPNQAQAVFGNGIRCVSGSTFRLPIISTDSFGDAIYTLDFTVAPVGTGNGSWDAGDTWNVQFWYRDPQGGGASFNLSDGLQVTLGP